MGRLRFVFFLIITLGTWLSFLGCGSSRPPARSQVPASIRLSPAIGSIDLGSTLSFTAAISGASSSLPLTYVSSNPAVLTVANNGLACAGTWDNPANPVVCTPQGIGVATVTASASGITSAPVTIYVHQHIDQIVVCAVGSSTCTLPLSTCFSTTSTTQPAQAQTYQANATSNGVDITSTVGPFNWSTVNAQVATITPLSTNQIPNGQVQVTAKTPGTTQIFAAITNTNSAPLNFATCAVQSISLAIATTGATSFIGPKGSFTINSTVTDINGLSITAVPLTWNSTQPAVASVTGSGISGSVSGNSVGGATITASCAPPSCNIGIVPMQAVYSMIPVTVAYTGSAAAATAYVTSTGCSKASSTQSCVTSLLSVGSSPAALATVSSSVNPPNSLRFSTGGTNAYMGSSKGLVLFTPGSNAPLSSVSNVVTGKVVAVSSDGKKAIVSDTQSAIQQVWVVDTTASSPSVTNFLISGATAAAFSPDNLKVYILAGSTLYVYSTQAALKSIPLGMPGTDVSFLGDGAFAYIVSAGSPSSQVTVRNTCDDLLSSPVGPNQNPFPVPGPVVSIRPLSVPTAVPPQPVPSTTVPQQLVALAPPNLDVITAYTSGTPTSGALGCPPPFNITNELPSAIILGQGAFTPVAFLVSTDGQKAYIVASNLGSVLVVDIPNGTTSSIPLVGSPAPLAADLSVDGQTLFVSANDTNVHVINLVAGGDIAQVPVPSTSLCSVTSGSAPPCLPDLLAVRP